MADKMHPYGTALAYSSDDSSYTTMSDVVSLKPPDTAVGESETTVINSASAAKEFVPSWVESGELSLTIRFHKTQFAALYGLIRAVRYWRITFPLIAGESTGSILKGQGFIKSIGITEGSAESDDVYDVEITIRYTGALTFTAGS